MRGMMETQSSPVKSYDYLLKFLLVGDSDVGKGEILDSLQDGSVESPYAYSSGECLCSFLFVCFVIFPNQEPKTTEHESDMFGVSQGLITRRLPFYWTGGESS